MPYTAFVWNAWQRLVSERDMAATRKTRGVRGKRERKLKKRPCKFFRIPRAQARDVPLLLRQRHHHHHQRYAIVSTRRSCRSQTHRLLLPSLPPRTLGTHADNEALGIELVYSSVTWMVVRGAVSLPELYKPQPVCAPRETWTPQTQCIHWSHNNNNRNRRVHFPAWRESSVLCEETGGPTNKT